jgi:putative spermidine/putrescine transport system substrate-binding protein
MNVYRLVGVPALVALVLVAVACSGAPAASVAPTSGGAAYDIAAAREQARTFHTLATPNHFGNYGEQFKRFCEVNFGFDCNREDRDIGSTSSSAEEIQAWLAEKNNPKTVLADIGILFIPQAEEVGILADYEPPEAANLPDDLHGPGWVTTFTGVPAWIANTDALEDLGVPVPETWADLTKPEYEGLVGLSRVGVSGSATWAFVAMNLAAGGSVDNWEPGLEYGRALLPNIVDQASIETFERGEVPIAIRYDHNNAAWIEQLEADGVNYQLVIPKDGSVVSPTTLMLNRYETAHADLGKMFMSWVLSDQGQEIFARYGGRPIRSVVDDPPLVIPDEAKEYWLPDEDYEVVETVDWRSIDAEEIQAMWENEVVGGG